LPSRNLKFQLRIWPRRWSIGESQGSLKVSLYLAEHWQMTNDNLWLSDPQFIYPLTISRLIQIRKISQLLFAIFE